MITSILFSLAVSHSDAWITTKAKLALWTTGGVRSTQVHVDTTEGEVTLYGKVDSDTQKKKAGNIAKGVKGVHDVRNLLQVVPPSQAKAVAKSDKEIKESVEKALKDDPMLADSGIKVKSVDKGVVLLSGKTETLMAHLNAIEDADSVDGVQRVSSEVKSPDEMVDKEVIVVYAPQAPSAKSDFSDARVTAMVKMKLLADSDAPGTAINVDTRNGNVVLFGNVETDKQKQAAEACAKGTDGVKMVRNDLQVVPASKKEMVDASDDDIKKKTKDLLAKAEYKDVDVDVKNGVVRLTGKVPTTWDRAHVASMTRAKTGARAVQADVEVKK